VEIRYRPTEEDADPRAAVLHAVDELAADGPGDVLVFLSGEREIRDTAEALRKHHPPHTEILPLFARLSATEQHRIFQPHKGRRIVLATNVAETSLTVPGIRYVVDAGYARLSRYSVRTKVQRLPIERISQASANQRAGRCGRVAAGVCIRLYAEDDYTSRPLFTDPEILRTNLASVILQMQNLNLGEVEDFPFVDPPDERLVRDGYRLLEELQAMDNNRITRLGRQLARLPVDPRLARMVLAASDLACLDEVLIIVAALSIQDPRERPADQQARADEAHKQFADEQSDFLAYVNLWRFYDEQRKHLSRSKLKKLCQTNFLSSRRMEEWRDIHSQLLQVVRELKLSLNEAPAGYDNVHQALLAGLLANIGFKGENNEFDGARGSRFFVFPGSGLAKKPPRWIMAGSLVETARLFAHTVARIEPEWVERTGAHLLKRHYFEPHWEKKPAHVAAYERTTLYGLTITPKRKVHFGPHDPVLARELFIRGALVEGEYISHAPFFRHNRDLIEEIESLEAKSRRQDILVDETILYAFYDERIPAGIYNGHGFEKWRKEAEQENPKLLFLDRDSLMRHGAEAITGAQYPATLSIDGAQLQLHYHFAPGEPDDGVTVDIPLPLLPTLTPGRFEWLVPGLLEEKITQLIKSLPKSARRHFVPAPDFARACVQALEPSTTPLADALAHQLLRMTGVTVARSEWRPEILPPHLHMNFRVLDQRGKTVASGRDLVALQHELTAQAQKSFAAAPAWPIERDGLTDFDIDSLPDTLSTDVNGVSVTGFPALLDKRDSVAVKVLPTAAEAARAHRCGLNRLFQLRLHQQVKYLQKNLPRITESCLRYASLGSCDALKADVVTLIIDQVFIDGRETIRSRATFEARLEGHKGELVEAGNRWGAAVYDILEAHAAVQKALKEPLPPSALFAVQDIQGQLERLVYPGFVAKTPAEWLPHLPRYLKAILKRLEKLPLDPARDRKLLGDIAPHWQRILANEARIAAGDTPALVRYRWLAEELRVSLYAQELRTIAPISTKRLDALWLEIEAGIRGR
jgi:ATP-dependent helicase HrpA